MENSALKIFDSGFDSVVANGTTKAIKYNNLCYEISLLHKKLNDAYELVKYWVFKNEFSLKIQTEIIDYIIKTYCLKLII